MARRLAFRRRLHVRLEVIIVRVSMINLRCRASRAAETTPAALKAAAGGLTGGFNSQPLARISHTK